MAGFFLLIWALPWLPPGPQTWGLFPFAAFLLVAWALSVGIEYGVYLCLPPWRRLPHLLRAVILSNLASYAILFVAFKNSLAERRGGFALAILPVLPKSIWLN